MRTSLQATVIPSPSGDKSFNFSRSPATTDLGLTQSWRVPLQLDGSEEVVQDFGRSFVLLGGGLNVKEGRTRAARKVFQRRCSAGFAPAPLYESIYRTSSWAFGAIYLEKCTRQLVDSGRRATRMLLTIIIAQKSSEKKNK